MGLIKILSGGVLAIVEGSGCGWSEPLIAKAALKEEDLRSEISGELSFNHFMARSFDCGEYACAQD